MGKKKEDLPVGQAQPAAQAAPVPVAKAPGGMRAAMKAAAVTAAPEKEAKAAPEDVKVEDAKLVEKINSFIEEKAKANAAVGRMNTLDGDIRPSLIRVWFEKCRSLKQFIKTIKVNGIVNFTNPQLKVAAPNAAAKTTKDSIADGLIVHWGDKYETYHKETCVLKVKESDTTPATIEFLKQALDRVELTDKTNDVLIALATEALKKTKAPEIEAALAELKTRKDRVQGQTFGRMFEFEFGIGFQSEQVGDEKVEILKRDMALSADVEAKVREAIAKNLLTLNDGAMTAQKSALAAAEEKLLKEEIARQNQKNLSTAAAAGAAAGAALAAKAS